jgi:flagellar hook-length control protein FliK
MTGVAALPAISLPDIATAMPKTGDSAPGTESVFDALIAALAPTVSDQTSGPALALPQRTPLASTGASDAVSPQTVLSDAVASFEAALGAATSVSSLLPSQLQSDPAKPDTTLPNPIIADSAGAPPPQDGNIAPAQPRPGRSERPGTVAPTSTATPDASLVALAMILPQLPPAGDVPAAPVNPPVADVTIANTAKTGAPNPLPGMETNVGPQKDVANAAAANLPLDSAAQPQPAKGDANAIPAQAAIPFALSQAGSAAAALPLKGAPSSAAETPTANSADRRGQSETIARASKTTASTVTAQADNAAPPPPNSNVSATADRTPSNSNTHTETAAHASQDVAAIAIQRPDNLAAPVVSNGYASPAAANHVPIELSGITAANASWASAPQTGAVPMSLALSAAGVVPDQASVDALALRIAAKSADGESQFQIRLDPPSLGRIEIHLNVDSQGNAQAQLSADRPQTLDALQRDSGALERALKDAGLDLPGGLSFSLKGDGKSAAWRDSQNSGRGRAKQIDAIDAANSTAAILGLTSTGQAWGAASIRLDIRV